MRRARHTNNRIAVLEPHNANALRVATDLADLGRRRAHQHAAAAHDNHRVGGRNRQHRHDKAILVVGLNIDAPLAAARLRAGGAIFTLHEVLDELRALTETVAGDGEQGVQMISIALRTAHHANDLVGVGELDALDARGVAAHHARIIFVEADRHAFLGREQHMIGASG